MPDLDPSSISSSPSLSLVPSPNFIKPISSDAQNSLLRKTLNSNIVWKNHDKENKKKVEDSGKSESISDRSSRNGIAVLHPDVAERKTVKSLSEHVKDWAQRKTDAGAPDSRCYLSFRVRAPKLAVCLLCQNSIHPAEVIVCSIRGCGAAFHITCAEEGLVFSSGKPLKCPQHACYLCKEKTHLWRCMRCPLASHKKCMAFPQHVLHFPDHQWQGICWRHNSDWRLEREQSVPANNMEEVFSRLPLPYIEEDFKFDDFVNWKDTVENKLEPPPYVHIKRNVYLVKKKKDNVGADIGCANCSSSECGDDCVCRVQCISCSKACRCSETCTNRPFRKEKKISIVKTALCGWGVVAAESISKGDFIIEYIGEVIDDALCEQRLWDMKYKGVNNFYMCEIRKDFTIDATFKGNTSRFLNHSCHPNCKLEKWQVEGETRVGVFASRSIQIGEPLTYDYRFVQFGPEVKCHCGAANCQGYLGTKKKISKVDLCWGSKRKRTATSCLTIINNHNNNV